MCGVYDVKIIDRLHHLPTWTEQHAKPKPTKAEEKKEYYCKHLKMYGNTVVRDQDVKRLNGLMMELKDWGYPCRVELYEHHEDGIHKNRIKNKDYILWVEK